LVFGFASSSQSDFHREDTEMASGLDVVARPLYSDPELNKLSLDLQAANSALGFLDEDTYIKGDDCLGKISLFFESITHLQHGISFRIFPESVRDMIRCLRRDDEDHTLRREMLRSRVIFTDLVPLIKYHGENEELFDLVIRLVTSTSSSLE
jgi:hypothetical protein